MLVVGGLPFIFTIDCTIRLTSKIPFQRLQETILKFSNQSSVANVGRLNKVKDRLKNFIR